MFRSCHCLFVQCLNVGAPQLVEVEVTLQSGWQERGLLGVEGVLGDGAGGGGRGRGQMESVAVGVAVGSASVLLLQVEVTQADRQAGVICFTSQRGGADCGEGAWAQAVGRDNLTVCKWREMERRGNGIETGRELWLIVFLLCLCANSSKKGNKIVIKNVI